MSRLQREHRLASQGVDDFILLIRKYREAKHGWNDIGWLCACWFLLTWWSWFCLFHCDVAFIFPWHCYRYQIPKILPKIQTRVQFCFFKPLSCWWLCFYSFCDDSGDSPRKISAFGPGFDTADQKPLVCTVAKLCKAPHPWYLKKLQWCSVFMSHTDSVPKMRGSVATFRSNYFLAFSLWTHFHVAFVLF